MQAILTPLIPQHYRILASNGEDILIELEDTRHIIYNNGKFYSTQTRDHGIQFCSTGYLKIEELNSDNLKTVKYLYEKTSTSLRFRIMEILKLDKLLNWEIIDHVGNLYLIHYTEDADMQKFGHLRGVLVDVEKGVVIASSFGYTSSTVTNHLSLNDKFIDKDGTEHQFDKDHTVIKKVYEGTIVRVIFYDGQIYRITHKKIRPLKSRWGNAPFFTKMYHEANGPKDVQIFNVDKKYSPYCYVFLIVHPKLLIATRENVQQPYLVLLDIKQMYSVDKDCPYPIEQVETKMVHLFNNVIVPPILTVEEANKFLKCGYYEPLNVKDERQTAGESVIMYKYNNGQVVDILKVNSKAFEFRSKLRNNDPNLYRRFFELAHFVHSIDTFDQKFIIYNTDVIKAPMMYLETGKLYNNDKNELLHQIWLNFVVSLPLPLQNEALNFKQSYIKDREGVMNWLYHYHRQNIIDKNIIGDRGVNILTVARGCSKDEEAIKRSIRGLIYKEYGNSLYNLVKLHNKNKIK